LFVCYGIRVVRSFVSFFLSILIVLLALFP